MANALGEPARVAAHSYLTTQQAAVFLGVSARTLEKWRLLGRGPAYRKLGGRLVRYAIDDLEEFAGDRRRSTSDPGRGT